MGEKAPQEIRERVWVEKFDHDAGPEPVLVETTFMERTRAAVVCPNCVRTLPPEVTDTCPYCTANLVKAQRTERTR